MVHSKSRLLSLLCILALAISAQAGPPKLIVSILVDQMRYDYLERFHDQFVDGGFKLLTDKGAFMTSARYNYYPTFTGPGHASAFSGSPPAMNGVIGNEWFDKRARKVLYCCADSSVIGVGTTEASGKMSPRNFIGDNFADELRLRYRSKVVGISMKDRGAILPAGKKPLGAYWFESSSGNFVTSTYYMAALPNWVRAFNDRKRPAEFFDQPWDRLLKPELYEREDNLPGEGNLPGENSPTFPHVVKRPSLTKRTVPDDAPPAAGAATEPAATPAPAPRINYDNILPTPFSNQLLAEFARAAIEGEHLGEGAGPDLITVSFSAIDACGHRFGPYSQEVQDITLRLDRQLADLFAYLDKKFGLANVVITLTADHAVAPTPEFARMEGLDGQRIDDTVLMTDLMPKLSQRFGTPNVLLQRRMFEGQMYFNHDALRDKGIDPDDVVAFISDWAFGTGKFQAVYGRNQILNGGARGIIGERVTNGFNAERSGDIVLIYKPYSMLWGGKTGTTHGSPYSYDTQVPILFYGAPFKPGRYADEFSITDLVPTLCAALHMNAPAMAIGKPLAKALADAQ